MSDSESSAGGSPAPQQPTPEAQQPALDGAPSAEDGAPQEDELDTSFFPAPPAYYKLYTAETLALPEDAPERRELEAPDIDLILQGGSYSVFGETWPVEEVLPTLGEMSVKELFDPAAGSSALSTLLSLSSGAHGRCMQQRGPNPSSPFSGRCSSPTRNS